MYKVERRNLLDPNMDKKIVQCNIRQTGYRRNEISVTYKDQTREIIWHYNPIRFEFESDDFIGMTKLEAVFYCDQKASVKRDEFQNSYIR